MMDIGTLASILRKYAAKVADRTSVKPQELSAAEDLANQLGKAVRLREQAPQMKTPTNPNPRAARRDTAGNTWNQYSRNQHAGKSCNRKCGR